MAEKNATRSKIITVAADSKRREMPDAIGNGIAEFLKSDPNNELVLDGFVIHFGDFSSGGYGKALLTVTYTVGKKK